MYFHSKGTRLGGIYILHHLGFRVRIDLDRGAVEPLPILNMPGVEGLKVGMLVAPKLRVGVADNELVEKLNPLVAESNKTILHKLNQNIFEKKDKSEPSNEIT